MRDVVLIAQGMAGNVPHLPLVHDIDSEASASESQKKPSDWFRDRSHLYVLIEPVRARAHLLKKEEFS